MRGFNIVLLALVIGLSIKIYYDSQLYSGYSELIARNDSLRHEVLRLKTKRDTIYKLIDSSKVKVEVIERWYEKKTADITNQSVTDDMLFFANYISENDK